MLIENLYEIDVSWEIKNFGSSGNFGFLNVSCGTKRQETQMKLELKTTRSYICQTQVHGFHL